MDDQWIAGMAVDPYIIDLCSHRCGSQCKVDAQSFVFGKLGSDVVPPGKHWIVRILGSCQIGKAQVHDPLDSSPFFIGCVLLVLPPFGVIEVEISHADVEVTGSQRSSAGCILRAKLSRQLI